MNLLDRLLGRTDMPRPDFSMNKADTPKMSAPMQLFTGGVAQPTLNVPPSWMQDIYAPGWPIQPLVRPSDPEIPREIDFPIAANVSIQPRVHYGLMPFSALTEAYQTLPEITLAVHTITREIAGFNPILVDQQGKPVKDHDYKWLIEHPDGRTPWGVWITRFLESVLVFDAGAVFIQKDEAGYLTSLRYVDGSTLFLLIDNHGEVPKPPHPAFVQIIKGTPFGWYTTHDIWYRPRYRRHNAPYGMSPIEMVWPWVLILANVEGFELAHYRQGNMPEGVATAPPDWSLDQINVYEQVLNARMSSGPAERNRWRVMPNGFEFTPLKRGETFPIDLYEQARENILLSYGIPPSEFGQTPGEGLGGKGYMDAMQSALYRNCLLPISEYIQDMINSILLRFNITDVTMKLSLQTQDLDPQAQSESVIAQMSAGLLTFNQARAKLGEEPVPGGDLHMLIQGKEVTVLDDYFQGKRPDLEARQMMMNRFNGQNEQPPDQKKPVKSKAKEAEQMPPFGKADLGEVIEKHCGVCPDDDRLVGASPVDAQPIDLLSHGANDPQVITIEQQGKRYPALWKPGSRENEKLTAKVGGSQYLREVAAYRVDRSLRTYLVPVAYLSEINHEPGAVVYYTAGPQPRRAAQDYDLEWIEKAAVLDMVLGQLDRETHNWFTHPDEAGRPILFDNGLTFPAESKPIVSAFASAYVGKALSADVIDALAFFATDTLLHAELAELVGSEAMALCLRRTNRLLTEGALWLTL